MRGPDRMAVALRRPDGRIGVYRQEFAGWARGRPYLRWPLIRGSVALGEALTLGVSSLLLSAREMAEAEGQKVGRLEMAGTLVASVALAVGLFILLPTWAVVPLARAGARPLVLNLVEGLIRVAVLLAYVVAISRIREIRRVLEYHGAEHKVIWAQESGGPLTVEAARRQPRLHPRCGTAFLLVAVVASILCFAFLGWPALFWRVTSRLALLPLVAGVAYEGIRFSARGGRLGRILAAPGLWLQGFTTREPDDGQIEVAICALRAVLEGGDPGCEPGPGLRGDGDGTLAG